MSRSSKVFAAHPTFTAVAAGLALLGAAVATPGAAWAGRGSSPGAIKAAIASGSVDAISAELERSSSP